MQIKGCQPRWWTEENDVIKLHGLIAWPCPVGMKDIFGSALEAVTVAPFWLTERYHLPFFSYIIIFYFKFFSLLSLWLIDCLIDDFVTHCVPAFLHSGCWLIIFNRYAIHSSINRLFHWNAFRAWLFLFSFIVYRVILLFYFNWKWHFLQCHHFHLVFGLFHLMEIGQFQKPKNPRKKNWHPFFHHTNWLIYIYLNASSLTIVSKRYNRRPKEKTGTGCHRRVGHSPPPSPGESSASIWKKPIPNWPDTKMDSKWTPCRTAELRPLLGATVPAFLGLFPVWRASCHPPITSGLNGVTSLL